MSSSTTTPSTNEYHNEDLIYLRQHYHNLQEQLAEDDARAYAADLLELKLQVTEAERMTQEAKAAAAHEDMQRAIDECKWAAFLQEQAQKETTWAVDETAWMGSMNQQENTADLGNGLLAQAAHDIVETDTLWQTAQAKRLEALNNEVHAKDLLWTLVQREENLKALQDSQDETALQKWVDHEMTMHKQKDLQVGNDDVDVWDPVAEGNLMA